MAGEANKAGQSAGAILAQARLRQSKTANILFAVGMTQRFVSDGINTNAVHPGGIMTGLQKYVSRDQQIQMGWINEAGTPNPRMKTVEQGAATSIWAAIAPELDTVSGKYLEDCTVAQPWSDDRPMSGVKSYALDPANAERLWSISEQAIRQPS